MDKTASKPMPDECAAQTPIDDLERNALAHYEEISAKACHWYSVIPKAIKFYFDAQRRHNPETQAVAQLEVRNGIASLKHLLAPIDQVSDGMMLYRSPSEPQASVREAALAAGKEINQQLKDDPYPEAGVPTAEYLAGIIAQAFAGFAPKGGEDCEHPADRLTGVHFGREGWAHWCQICGAHRYGTGNKWVYPECQAHPAQPPAQVDAEAAATEIYQEYWGGDTGCTEVTSPVHKIATIIRKHTLAVEPTAQEDES